MVYQCYRTVAPLSEARIEMEADGRPDLGDGVAPSAGAWIEIYKTAGGKVVNCVAPSPGAWIEIHIVLPLCEAALCRSLRRSVD